jgi:hypothetical protein
VDFSAATSRVSDRSVELMTVRLAPDVQVATLCGPSPVSEERICECPSNTQPHNGLSGQACLAAAGRCH